VLVLWSLALKLRAMRCWVNVDVQVPVLTKMRHEMARLDSLEEELLVMFVHNLLNFHDNASIGSIHRDYVEVKLELAAECHLCHGELLVHVHMNVNFLWTMLIHIYMLSSIGWYFNHFAVA
jgi:hypothetical protein